MSQTFITDIDYARREWDQEMLQKYGWFVHYVPGDDPLPLNAHTHGVKENFNHPDIQIVLPIDTKVLHGVFVSVLDNIRENAVTYEAGKQYDDVLMRFPVQFKKAIECEREVLRLILPDPNGFFPDHPMCDENYREQDIDTFV
jgi:hypothetical protein